MNAPELAVSPNASRRVPGVNVPVAAPSCALDFASVASCLRLCAWAGGNWLVRGCSAAGSSATAGGRTGPEAVVWLACVVVLEACVLLPGDDGPDVVVVDEEP